MAEPWSAVPEWMGKADGDVDQTHDLATLSRQLEAVDRQWSWDAEELSDLSSRAVLARYPGFETSAEELAELVQIANGLRDALKMLLGSAQNDG